MEKRKKGGSQGENKDSGETTENKENKKDQEETDEDKAKDPIIPTKATIKRRIIIRLALLGVGALGLLFFVFAIASFISGGRLMVAPMTSLKSYDTEEFAPLSNTESKQYEKELEYYKKLQKIEEEKGDVINTNYLNALLLDLYYEHDFQLENEELADSLGIDYKAMTDNASKFANLLESFDSTDYENDGEIYKLLKESDEFKEYYKEALKEKDIDTILKNIKSIAGEFDKIDDSADETVISSETKVTVNKTSTETSTKSTTTTSKSMTINDYIADSIYATTDNYSNSELVKAYTITYSTNIVSENKKLSISSNNALTTGSTCSVKNGCSYDDNGNLVDGKGERTSQNTVYYNGGYYYKTPLSSDEVKAMNTNINSVFGNVLVNSDGTYPTLDTSRLAGLGDGDYKSVLSSTYGDLKYKNVGENSYILDGNYGTKKVLTPVLFYDQKDYPKDSFCGLRKSTIGGSGCGVTAMAIVASTYEYNRKYDPIFMNKEARSKGACSSSGTAQNFFQKEARTLGYKYMGGTKYNKSLLNSVLKHLQEGHLVVVRMLSGHFTNGGHYMVLGGVDPETKKVYVYDPNNRSNKKWRKTGNGWYSFNDIIVKEAYNFYIIWKG